MSCSTKRKLESTTLELLVANFIETHRPLVKATQKQFKQLEIREATLKAGALQVPTKDRTGWRLHPHFHRPWYYTRYASSFRTAGRRVLKNIDKVQAASELGFHASYCLIKSLTHGIPGLGHLAWYDITDLLGFKYGFEPKAVYLHAGTRDGANQFPPSGKDDCGPFRDGEMIAKRNFPHELHELSAGEIESFLCICKDDLKALQRRGLLPAMKTRQRWTPPKSGIDQGV